MLLFIPQTVHIQTLLALYIGRRTSIDDPDPVK